jgi:histidinol-phosphate aminotransferase
MSRDLFRRELASVRPYTPGRPVEDVRREYGLARIEKLASNENPLGPSPLAVEAMRRELGNVNLYPDPAATELRAALASAHGLEPDGIVVANGGEHLLQMIAQTFVNSGDEAIMAYPTFDLYASTVTHMGGVPVILPLADAKNGYKQAPTRFLERINDRTKLAYICNPNNPTAAIETKEEMDAFFAEVPGDVVVVIDEAYYDYARSDPRYFDGIEVLKKRPNTIVLRTFSKISGIAGLRSAYVLTSPEIALQMQKVRGTFCASRLAQVASLAALKDEDHTKRSLELNASSIGMMNDYFDRKGLERIESRANFVFVNVGTSSKEVFEALQRRGVIVRPGYIWGWDTWLRVSSGTIEQTRFFIESLEAELLQGARRGI